MKKFFAMLLAICLIAGLLPVTVLAADANPARFVFANEEGASNLEVIINQGDAPVYLKTVGKKATTAGASESSYHIKVTYNAGETPKLYLKGAEIQTYGDASGDPAITIGSKTPEDACNDLDVEIIVEKNSTFSHTKVWGDSHIKSYITGTLTITRVKGTLVLGHKMCRQAAIYSVGDIVLKDLYTTISSGWGGKDRANYIQSAKGDIIIDGGKVTLTTKNDGPGGDSAANNRVIYAESGDILIQNGATLKITMAYSGKVFGTPGEVIIKDSTVSVKVTSETGTIFSDYAPVIEGYAGGYTALGDDAAYNEDNFDLLKSFSIEPVGAEEPTEPATQPTTKPTEPATQPSTEPATQPSTEPATQPTTPATQPTTPATQPSTEPSVPATQPTAPADKDTQPAANINTIILVVGLIVIVAFTAASAVMIIKKDKEKEAKNEE